ncbi:N-acetyltransferase family protein [Nonomuraea sp. CA-143628]|uniref:GNAT family N-acetyltransferase n=1 Tax=Nonomuraea sp. CA-143628 TaxID=3239997 RepID=UPI003D947E79
MSYSTLPPGTTGADRNQAGGLPRADGIVTAAPPTGSVRPAVPDDLPAVAALCTEHAAFERSGPVPADLADRLGPVLFSENPKAWCLVADRGGEVIGYATCSLEFSTWQAAAFVHMDCLFVAEPYRGEGWGRALLDAVQRSAEGRGIGEVQWQTPDWNVDAIRFYHRAGAQGASKVRFSLAVGPPRDPASHPSP